MTLEEAKAIAEKRANEKGKNVIGTWGVEEDRLEGEYIMIRPKDDGTYDEAGGYANHYFDIANYPKCRPKKDKITYEVYFLIGKKRKPIFLN